MENATSLAQHDINTRTRNVVNLCTLLGTVLLGITLISPSFASAAGPPQVMVPLPAEPTDIDRNLPDVEIRNFPVVVLKRSSAEGVYLFEDPTAALPSSGKIVLLKKEKEPFLALRVLKVYLDKKEFAAKKLRAYHGHDVINSGEQYIAYEKLSDIPAPPVSAQDAQALSGLETDELDQDHTPPPAPDNTGAGLPAGGGYGSDEPNSGAGLPVPQTYDPELDLESSPPPVGAVDGVGNQLDEAGELTEGGHTHLMVEDITPIDPNRYGITGQLGYFRNIDPANNSSIYFVGGGMRFSSTLQRMLFVKKADVQDSLIMEFGVAMYKTLLQSSTNNADSYNIFPTMAVARYQVNVGETFAGFIYGGLLKNFSIAAPGSNVDTQNILSQFMPAGGIGGLFRLGPSWDIRFDLGIDFIGAGLVLGFQ